MAENHPVGFQWVIEARERGATIIHVDPRFTRTSAMADMWVPLRAGTRHRVPRRDGELRARARPRVPRLRRRLHQRVGDHRLTRSRARKISTACSRAGTTTSERYSTTLLGLRPQAEAARSHASAPALRLSDPARATSRATRRRWWKTCAACRRTRSCASPSAFCRASGPERTGAICYAVGLTQHSTGVQIIRTAAILQLLLGNIGRPGGGILALRGHASIQGSTDIPTLYDILPGYLPMPSFGAERCDARRLRRRAPVARAGWWTNFDKYIDLVCSRPGTATPPRRRTSSASAGCRASAAITRTSATGSTWPTADGARSRTNRLEGLFVMGQNPAVGAPNAAPRAPRARATSNGSSCATWSRPRRRRSGWTLRRSQRGELETEDDRHRGVLLPGRRARREGRLASRTRSACCNGATRRSIRPATRAATPGSSTTSVGASRRVPPRDASARTTTGCARSRGTTRSKARTTNRTSTASCRRSTAGDDRRADARRWLPPISRPTAAPRAAAGSTPASIRSPAATGRATASRAARTATAGASPGPRIAASSITAPRRDRTARRGASARSSSGGTPAPSAWTGLDMPDFARDKAPDYVQPPGRQRRRRARRRCAVHHARRRARLDLGAERARGRSAAGALRAVRVAGQQSGCIAQQINPAADRKARATTPYAQSPGDPRLPLRPDDVPADRASHRGRHVAHALAPRRAAAGALLRDLARAGASGRGRERRVGPRRPPRAAPSRRARSSRRGSGRSPIAGPRRPPGRRCRITSAARGLVTRRRRQRPRRHLGGAERAGSWKSKALLCRL